MRNKTLFSHYVLPWNSIRSLQWDDATFLPPLQWALLLLNGYTLEFPEPDLVSYDNICSYLRIILGLVLLRQAKINRVIRQHIVHLKSGDLDRMLTNDGPAFYQDHLLHTSKKWNRSIMTILISSCIRYHGWCLQYTPHLKISTQKYGIMVVKYK